jgi:hypothetical protein
MTKLIMANICIYIYMVKLTILKLIMVQLPMKK